MTEPDVFPSFVALFAVAGLLAAAAVLCGSRQFLFQKKNGFPRGTRFFRFKHSRVVVQAATPRLSSEFANDRAWVEISAAEFKELSSRQKQEKA